MTEEKCPCCSNHCNKDALGCHRGQDYFGNGSKEAEPTTKEECIIADLRKCGHMLHHNRDLNPTEILANLNEDELDKLQELLSKICE